MKKNIYVVIKIKNYFMDLNSTLETSEMRTYELENVSADFSYNAEERKRWGHEKNIINTSKKRKKSVSEKWDSKSYQIRSPGLTKNINNGIEGQKKKKLTMMEKKKKFEQRHT